MTKDETSAKVEIRNTGLLKPGSVQIKKKRKERSDKNKRRKHLNKAYNAYNHDQALLHQRREELTENIESDQTQPSFNGDMDYYKEFYKLYL